MKKGLKVFIAFVLIVGLAVGAYFIFSGKDNSKLVHQNVYYLTYNIKDGETNIVQKINDSVDEMNQLISDNSLSINDIHTNLKLYSDLYSYYFVVANQILDNGNFISGYNNEQYIRLAVDAYNKSLQIYNQSYEYLKQTYFKIQDKVLYIDTVKTYIENFYEIFKNLIPEFNAFYYNTCLAYAYGIQNTVQKNNAYKLTIAFYAETINQYYLNENDRTAIKSQTLQFKNKITQNFSTKYFDEKAVYDNLIQNVKDINVAELALNLATGKENDFLDAIQDNDLKTLAEKYIQYVARG